jgi:hypothetical protein
MSIGLSIMLTCRDGSIPIQLVWDMSIILISMIRFTRIPNMVSKYIPCEKVRS